MTPPPPGALRALLASSEGTSGPDAAAIDAFIADHQFPLVEGPRVTFIWRGEAEGVRLQHWLFGLESSNPFERVVGTDFWWITVELRRRSRVEYKFLVEHGGDHRELVGDPFNPNLAHDPFGANSVCHTDGYVEPDWIEPSDEARKGEIIEHQVQSHALGGTRRVQVYRPARFRTLRGYPLLIAHDGADYLRFSAMKTVLDNLIHRLEIPPMIVALVDPGDRLTEYADDPRHATFLATELLPMLQKTYPVSDRPADRGLLGASFGAVASLSCAWRHPGLFGKLLLQSGSFAFTDIGESRRGPAFDPVVRFVNAFRDAPGKPADKVFLSCGIYESLIYENRSLVPMLQSTGMGVKFEERRDGHNWENWRDGMRTGLTWLFPGPLWLIYE